MLQPLIASELARLRHEELVRAAAEYRQARELRGRRTVPGPVRRAWLTRIRAHVGRSVRLPGLAAPPPPC